MSGQTLQELVLIAASQHADRVAVMYNSDSITGKKMFLLYRDLTELTKELSGIFMKHFSPSGGLIGLYCSDDLFIPVWILGILLCEAAYVPLDPEAPGLLSAKVINQCGVVHCAVKSDLIEQFKAALVKYAAVEVLVELPKFKLTLVQIDLLVNSEHELSNKRVRTGSNNADLKMAYVLHTSGTTGPPKTVRVPHGCILPNILHLRSLFQMNKDDVVFLASPLTFDPSVVEMFLALSSGAQLLIVPTIVKKIPNRLAQVLFKYHKTTVLQITPTLLMGFGDQILKQDILSSNSSLRVLALGGETCPSPSLLTSWRHKDNKTSIYNIYGITEVSCWASCYKLPDTLLQSESLAVPLGTPLMGTVIEVRDEDDCVTTKGEGQVFIGGEHRVCLLDDENLLVPGMMRASGDWVNVTEGQLYFQGRKDRIVKRNGKRLNLDSLQQLMLTLSQVQACAVGLYKGFRLLAFVVPSTAFSLTTVQPQQEQTHSPEHQEYVREEQNQKQAGNLKRIILNQLSLLLPSHGVPDTLVFVPALCLTHHGKVDTEALMRIYEKQREAAGSSCEDGSTLKQTLITLWQNTLGLAADASIDDQSNFLFSGGDSLKALSLCDDIIFNMRISSSELLELILNKTFSDVLRHITLQRESCSPSLSEVKKRHADPVIADEAKRDRKSTKILPVQNCDVIVVKRAGEMIQINSPNLNLTKYNKTKDFCQDVDLRLRWSSDTGRCVDASPVILIQNRRQKESGMSKATVFIGSHSHRMQAIDLLTGILRWERVLGDRIEASAAVTHCGFLVVVGCYDGCVYFLCAESGETQWVFETGDAVKSTPAVDPLTGLVMVGSHDGCVYGLNHQAQRCVWKHHCGGGAVFSSPHLNESPRHLYVATLGGRILCLNPDSGDVLWFYSKEIPFFSSPMCVSHLIIIGSVDGNICCFSDSGKLLWQYLTEGPVFSSPCFIKEQQRLLCGSHDGRLYCLDLADGSLVWTFQTTGKVYSAPSVFDGSVVGRKRVLVGLTSTDGSVWILDAEDGQMITSHTLPGELFSSPVVWEQSLVVGCRNDYVYCLDLTFKEDKRKDIKK